MTPARHPHQIFWEDAKPEDFMNAQLMDWIQYVGDISTQYELNFIRNFGGFWSDRLSHTSPQAPRPPCEECIYQAQATSAAKAERERENQRVLDSMKQFVDSGYYTGFAAPQTERILWKIESLRAQPHPQPELHQEGRR